MFSKLNDERKARILSDFPQYPFPAHLGIKIEELNHSEAKLELKMQNSLTQGMGFIHGGAIATLCDTAVAMALATVLDDDDKMLTIEFKLNFIATADDDIIAIAKIIHKGRKTAVGEVDVKKRDCTLIAR